MAEQAQTKRKFKLLNGDHYDGQNQYKAGDIVESTEDLAVKFENKFEEVK